VFCISEQQADRAAAADPGACQAVRRRDARKSFLGLQVELGRLPAERLRGLIEEAWRQQAPKKLVLAVEQSWAGNVGHAPAASRKNWTACWRTVVVSGRITPVFGGHTAIPRWSVTSTAARPSSLWAEVRAEVNRWQALGAMMGRSWSRAAFILAMAVPLAGASVAVIGPSALAASVHTSAALSRGRDLPRASTAAEGEDLLGVSAVSATDAWAVGYKCSNAECGLPDLTYSTLIEHWNGKKWATVASPSPGPSNQLTGVSAVSATDAWAVGNTTSGPVNTTPGPALILHWNGRKWSKTPIPEPSNVYFFLSGVSAISATDAWAVGTWDAYGVNSRALTLHWNGRKWSKVVSPNPVGRALSAVSTASAADAWAVGSYINSADRDTTLTEHWNGKKWSKVASPGPSPGEGNALSGVSTLTPTDAWAVGYEGTLEGQRTMVLRWNGKAWKRVASPDPGSSYDVLDGVSAVSASDAWAVGDYSSSKGATDVTLILRWNGKAWTRVPSPSPNPNSSGVNNLAGVSAVSPGRAFAAGSSDDAFTGVNLTLIVGWNGKRWARP
jgi:hypothetical protein